MAVLKYKSGKYSKRLSKATVKSIIQLTVVWFDFSSPKIKISYVLELCHCQQNNILTAITWTLNTFQLKVSEECHCHILNLWIDIFRVFKASHLCLVMHPLGSFTVIPRLYSIDHHCMEFNGYRKIQNFQITINKLLMSYCQGYSA